MFAAHYDLPTVYETGGKEIKSGLVATRLCIRMQLRSRYLPCYCAYKIIDAESRWEDVGKVFPERRDSSTRPGIPEMNSRGTEVNTNSSIHVSRLRIAMEAVMAKKMQAAR